MTESNNMFTLGAMLSQEKQNNPAYRFGWYHLPMILYAAAIIAVSSIPDLHTPQVRMFAFDKLAHFAEYAIFAAIVFRSFSNFRKFIPTNRAFLFAALFVAVFAAFDEYYQHFIPGRFSSAADAVADFIGAMLVLAFFELRRRRLAARKQGR
ncbi:MAG TPA: VanZ family protein [candidate division Zixibacteria bacterium]|nr:VanZ family protein [candidate division Zixibacteria bacterium]